MGPPTYPAPIQQILDRGILTEKLQNNMSLVIYIQCGPPTYPAPIQQILDRGILTEKLQNNMSLVIYIQCGPSYIPRSYTTDLRQRHLN